MAAAAPIASKYASGVIDHFNNPRNAGSIEQADNVGTGIVGAPACGDVLKLQIRVGPNNVIEDARFKAFGCGSAIASSSFATDWIKGKTIDESLQLTNKTIAKELALPPVKLHCSMLAEDAVKMAINDYLAKKVG